MQGIDRIIVLGGRFGTLPCLLLLQLGCTQPEPRDVSRAETGSVTIPLDRFRGLLRVQASMSDGRSYHLILDTGAGAAIYIFKTDDRPTRPSKRRHIVALGNPRSGMAVMWPELVYVPTQLSESVDGVLGLALFAPKPVALDLRAEVLVVGQRARELVHGRDCQMPFQPVMGIPVVRAIVDGGDSVDLIVDTGSNAALTLYAQGGDSPHGRWLAGAGIGGPLYGRHAGDRSLRIGQCDLGSVATVIRQVPPRADVNGSVGMGLWKDWDTIEIDFVRRNIMLIRRSSR